MKPSTLRLGWVVPGCLALALATALAAPTPAKAQQSRQIPQSGQAKRSPVRIYTHSSGAFSLIPPPGTQLAERQGALSVTIRSPKGYIISIQGGPDRDGMTLAQHMEVFEKQNVGEGKRWPKKLGGRQTKVNEYPAFEALYLSHTEAARATIMRVGKIDYVFIYIATPQAYAAELGEYFAVMASFHPGGSVAPASAPAGSQRQPAQDMARYGGKAPNAGRVMMFADANFGLTLNYPAEWVADRRGRNSVLFSGRHGTDAYYATVRLDRVAVPAHGDMNQSLMDVVADLRHQINTGTRDPVFLLDRPHHHVSNGIELDGHEVLAAFTYREQRFRRWTVVLPRPAMAEAYVWTYTAPDAMFDKYRQVASQILDSMTISSPETAATKF